MIVRGYVSARNTDNTMFSRGLSRGAVLHASIGRSTSSFRPSFIYTPIKHNRVMSSKTGFKQVQFIPHIPLHSSTHLYQLERDLISEFLVILFNDVAI